MPTLKTSAKSPRVMRPNQQSSMSPMRQFNSNLDQAEVVQSSIGNGLITASPLVAKNLLSQQASATRIGVRTTQKRPDTSKPTALGSNSGYLATIAQGNRESQKTPNKQQVVQFPVATASGAPMYEVYMRCVTWSRDSHGLFDYESRNIAKKNIKTQTGGKILRVNDDVEFVSIRTKPEDVHESAKPMIIVRQKHGKFLQTADLLVAGKFQVENDTIVNEPLLDSEGNPIADEDVNNKMFVVVRNTKSAQNNLDYKLCRGDVIKLGRIKFSVKDYKSIYHGTSEKKQAPADAGHEEEKADLCCTPQKLEKHVSRESLSQEFEEECIEIDCGVVDADNTDIQCKVCWETHSTTSNPLLNSCQCDGSVRFIHYECLKYWLKQKMAKKEEKHLISYSWKQFECEICKKPYPYVFKSNGISYRLIDVDPDIPKEQNYLLLESLTFEKNSSRMVHLIMPDTDKVNFKLGRGHESDVRVSDISVSRCHAIIKYN